MAMKDLTEEQKQRLHDAKTPEEVQALANEVGVELTDEDLDVIAAGGSWGQCGKTNECDNIF